MPSTDTAIITGKNANIGVRLVPAPEVKYTAIMPTAATSTASGSRRATGLVEAALGSAGGDFTTTPHAGREDSIER
ncbi:uncharacterized protein RMCN_5662 [Mycolicibacterium novocastrense]|uniref:Uncharacterized protein n=1 Tax=Mycolicibacterium novocastrense TaxID=59813 RepID=A0ABQ0KTQ9_MYCNV|nr:uncharacterized protein RMCN_5662 [Mycolicibacterium novocastrense]